MSDLISRQAALAEIDKNRRELLSLGMTGAEHILVHYGRRAIEELPTIDADTDHITQKALEAGRRGEEVRFYIGGKLFAVRELAQ